MPLRKELKKPGRAGVDMYPEWSRREFYPKVRNKEDHHALTGAPDSRYPRYWKREE